MEGNNETSTQTVEELMQQLAFERSEKERFKNASDKASAEAAKYKRELNSKLTDDEKKKEEQLEIERQRNEETELLKNELNRMKAVSAYKNIKGEQVVNSLIEAVSKSDHNAIADIIDAEIKAAVKLAQTDWLKSRPGIGVGTGAGLSKDDIMSISDREERLKAIALNTQLF